MKHGLKVLIQCRATQSISCQYEVRKAFNHFQTCCFHVLLLVLTSHETGDARWQAGMYNKTFTKKRVVLHVAFSFITYEPFCFPINLPRQ